MSEAATFFKELISFHAQDLKTPHFAFRFLRKHSFASQTHILYQQKNGFDNVIQYLHEENEKADVYLVANSFGIKPEFYGKSVVDNSIEFVYFAYSDLDYLPPGSINEYLEALQKHLISPSIVVQTSEGKFQLWWAVSPTRPTRNVISQLKDIAILSCGDSIGNVSRILRVPGFINHKNGQRASIFKVSPFYSRINIEQLHKQVHAFSKSDDGVPFHLHRYEQLLSKPQAKRIDSILDNRIDSSNFGLAEYSVCVMRNDSQARRYIKQAGWDIDMLVQKLRERTPEELRMYKVSCGYRHRFIMSLVGEAATKIARHAQSEDDQSLLAKQYIKKILFIIQRFVDDSETYTKKELYDQFRFLNAYVAKNIQEKKDRRAELLSYLNDTDSL